MARDKKAAHGFSWPNAVLNNTGSSARSCSPCILLHTAAYCCIRITVHHCTLYTTAHYILLTTAIYIPGTPNTTLPLHTTFTAWAQVVLQGGVASDQEGASGVLLAETPGHEGDNSGKGTAADDGDESSTGKLVDALVDLGRTPEGFNEMSTKTGSN